MHKVKSYTASANHSSDKVTLHSSDKDLKLLLKNKERETETKIHFISDFR